MDAFIQIGLISNTDNVINPNGAIGLTIHSSVENDKDLAWVSDSDVQLLAHDLSCSKVEVAVAHCTPYTSTEDLQATTERSLAAHQTNIIVVSFCHIYIRETRGRK